MTHAIRNQSGNPDTMWRRNRPFYISVCGSAFGALFQGTGLLLGPAKWRSSPSYAVIRAQLPMRVWGAVFLCVAITLGWGILRDWRVVRYGAAFGLLVVSIWCLCFLLAAFTGDLSGVPAAWIVWAVLLYVQTIGPRGGFAQMMRRDGTG